MKKIILIALAVLGLTFVNAQEVKYGVKGGLNVSNWSGDKEGYDYKSKAGFNAGVLAAIKFSEKITLQPEVLFSMQGVKVANLGAYINGTYITGDIKVNLLYINVPVMFKYYVAEKLNLEVGPQIGFLTTAKSVTKIDGYNGEHKEDMKDAFESIDFGLNFGAEYDFTEHLSLGARYNLGLSNIAKTEVGDNTKIHNSVFSLSVGYKF